jgi:hypothetical protein
MEKDAIFRISMSNRNSVNNAALTDVLKVDNDINFQGKIPLVVMSENETIDPGYYLFLEYGDVNGPSREYVKNLILLEDRYRDNYFSLDFSVPGKVYLSVSSFPIPIIQRYVDLPEIDGVQTIPPPGRYYIQGHQDFEFRAWYSGAPYKVTATSYYSKVTIDLDNTATESGGAYLYAIREIVEPWTIKIGPTLSSVGVENISALKVWAFKNTININVATDDIVSIYTAAGLLVRKEAIPSGISKFTLDKGVYVVTLKDGKVYKVVIR